MASYYRRTGADTFEPTQHAQGVWRPTEQHMGPASGLIAHALTTVHPRDDLQLARIAFEIYGVIQFGPTRVTVEVIRPGRTIELLEARLETAGRTAIRATAWRLVTGDTGALAGGAAAPMPTPEDWQPWQLSDRWAGGYIASLDARVAPDARPGARRVWVRTDVDLIEGEPVSDLAAFTTLVDTANGIGARVSPAEVMFPNTDLTIHYFRTPSFTGAQKWVGFDTRGVFGPDGIGLTSSALFDARGEVGRAEQILTVRPRGEG